MSGTAVYGTGWMRPTEADVEFLAKDWEEGGSGVTAGLNRILLEWWKHSKSGQWCWLYSTVNTLKPKHCTHEGKVPGGL